MAGSGKSRLFISRGWDAQPAAWSAELPRDVMV
jgi:hypothetical protein